MASLVQIEEGGGSQSGSRRSSKRTAGELKIGARECQFRWPVTKGDRDQRDQRGKSDCGLRPKGVNVTENNGGII